MSSIVLSCSLSLAASVASAADVAFEEDFLNNSGTNVQLNDWTGGSWSAYQGTDATTAAHSSVFLAGTGGSGTPTGYPGNPNDTYGFLAINPVVSQYAAVTNFSEISAIDQVETITWTMGNVSALQQVYVLVESGGNWYVSSSSYSNSGYTAGSFATANTASVTQTLDFATASWNEFTLTPDSEMSVGSSAALPSSSITGIGFFVQTPEAGKLVRLDTLKVTGVAIPEASSSALMLGVVLLGFALSRRRR